MRSTWLIRAARTATAVVLLAATVGVSVATAGPAPIRGAKRRGANLFALVFGVMNVNRWFCGINNIGELCVDPTNSPVVGGGFWPKGTPDQYIFNSGLQLAGQIPSNAGFAWAGDTVGAFFMDPRGDQAEGDPITLVFNSLDANDALNWPNGGIVRDTANFAGVLQGRQSVSQEDLWVRTWEGNPALLAGRTHPMGILVEERGMAWNFPTGNEDIIYFVFKFTNVTARTKAIYANATNDPAIVDELAAIGADFQNRNEARFNVPIPDGGYSITNLYAAFFADEDVGDAGVNYSTAVIPFDMMVAYKANFLEPKWSFPTDIFGPPFVASPGFVGLKFLKSPAGLTMFSNTLNSGTGYPDPVGVKQLYRYLSGTSSPASGDLPCTITSQSPLQRHWCFQAENFADTRSFQSSGPFTLNPGETRTIVEAYIQAAPTPVVSAFVGGDFKPGPPATGTEMAADTTKIRLIERAMGWITQSDADLNGAITENEVKTLPRSLLDKANVAQAVFNNKFLLPFAPEPPPFFLIPGDNQVTIVWQKSPTETVKTGGGDPFFQIASKDSVPCPPPLPNTQTCPNPLFDPNFRQYDVEGYRIYRGRTTGAMQLVAQFDYSGTFIRDYTGQFDYEQDKNGNGKLECAPELGIQGDCPVTFKTSEPFTTHYDTTLVGDIVQIPAGGRVALANGATLVLKADTAVTGGHSGFPPLKDNGVSFAYTDFGVRNSFAYYYAVTAFDINSFKSGPSSLESPRVTKQVTPRAPSGQEVAGTLSAPQLIGGDGSTLNANAPLPTINAATGIFSGPMPPSDGVTIGLSTFLPQLLSSAGGSVTVTIDSIVPGATLNGRSATYFITGQGSGAPAKATIPILVDGFSGLASANTVFPATNISTAQSARFGGDSTFALLGQATIDVPGGYRTASWGRGDINGDPSGSAQAGPRWWAGATNENTPKPNELQCTPASGGCLQADLSRNAGQIAGVSPLWHFQSYSSLNNAPMRNLEGIGATVARAADFNVFWGANGAVDSVVDVTHKVKVPFKSTMRASWGILNDSSFTNTAQASTADGDNTLLTWQDAFCVDPSPVYLGRCGSGATPAAFLMNHAKLTPVAATATAYGTTGMTTTGNGFIFYLNGHFFMMQMAALPTAGTVWHARFFSGSILGTGAAGDYSFVGATRPPAVPGLRIQVQFTGSTFDSTTTNTATLARVHTVPDPYYVTNALEATANTKVLKFVNLPARAIIRIYSVSGVLVQVITHDDPTGGSEQTWNLRNRNNQFVASGVYFYHVEAPDGKTKVGRFTVVNFAP